VGVKVSRVEIRKIERGNLIRAMNLQ